MSSEWTPVLATVSQLNRTHEKSSANCYVSSIQERKIFKFLGITFHSFSMETVWHWSVYYTPLPAYEHVYVARGTAESEFMAKLEAENALNDFILMYEDEEKG
jgi:hypothetical protein